MRACEDLESYGSWNTVVLPGRGDEDPTIILTRDFRMQDEQVYWSALREPFISEVTDDWWQDSENQPAPPVAQRPL